MEKRRILIVEDNEEMRAALLSEFQSLGHEVVALPDRRSALNLPSLDEFDVILSDLTDEGDARDTNSAIQHRERLIALAARDGVVGDFDLISAFKIYAANHSEPGFSNAEMTGLLDRALVIKKRFDELELENLKKREMIDFELPSDMSLMNNVLQYLIGRVSTLGVIDPAHSNLFVALDEAFVNAVKHGNRHDMNKHVRITADLSSKEARFTVEDEGEGFNVQSIPDPCDPENLFKTSGRGVLLIYNIMDEVKYNDRGNRLTMVKHGPVEPQLIEAGSISDKPVHN